VQQAPDLTAAAIHFRQRGDRVRRREGNDRYENWGVLGRSEQRIARASFDGFVEVIRKAYTDGGNKLCEDDFLDICRARYGSRRCESHRICECCRIRCSPNGTPANSLPGRRFMTSSFVQQGTVRPRWLGSSLR